MQVFNGYIKILKKSIPTLLIYVAVFTVILVLFSNTSSNSTTGTFEATKVDTAFINNDEDSVLAADLKDYLSDYCEFVDVGTEKEELEDALFIRKVEYILTVEEGFEQRFLDNKVVTVDKRSVPDSTDGVYIDNMINNYFNTLKSYYEIMPEKSLSELCALTRDTLDETASLNLVQDKTDADSESHYQVFYNFLSYLFIAGLVTCIGSIMVVFNDIHISRRINVAPVSNRSVTLQTMLANLIFSFVIFILMIVMSIVLSPSKEMTTGLALHILNAFVFMFCALGISYMVGSLLKSEKVIGAIATVLSLGLAFLSGAFVPQYLLPENVMKVARFTPNYWFVCVNDRIAEITTFTQENTGEIFGYMGIELIFAVALFCIAVVISKKRNQRCE
ncbi:ABC transporter permease [Anaerosporobacter faecicola]|uniref:ABC transporter permease n=1 Tax=Anaerosporobacter faecicola TaxID=2718714 RepID=UPI00143B054E|nr:ABC transporter permease [Anaerosporobacter faecicola]